MTPIPSSARQQREEVALLWVTRLAAEPGNTRLAESRLNALERADLERWLAIDPDNAHAYAEARQLWQLTGLAAAPIAQDEDAALQALLHKARRHRARPRRRMAALAVAATLVLAALLTLVWQPERWFDNSLADYHSAPGQRLDIALADGSEVTLDGDSAIDVELTAEGRNVVLRRGAAFFKVRHNGQGFVVHANGGEVRVVGTRFEVRRQAEGTQVTVEEGRVAVSAQPALPAQFITAGQRLDYHDGQLSAVQPIEPAQAFAWRDGRLSLRRQPLADVLEQLRRDYPGRILLLNASLGQRAVSGDFAAQDPLSVLAALQGVLGFELQRLPGGAVLIR
jgi:transmembrane sensor